MAVDKVTQYINQIFASLPETEQISAYRETLHKQLDVVFRAECAAGKSEDEAMAVVISSAPDYPVICAELNIFEQETQCDAREYDKQTRWCNFWASVAVGLFVLSPFAIFALAVWRWTYNLAAGIAFFLFSIGIGTGILLYIRRERAYFKAKTPVGTFRKVHVRHLVIGILLCIFAVAALVFSLSVWEGRARYWESANCLLYAGGGVAEIVYYALCRKWLK